MEKKVISRYQLKRLPQTSCVLKTGKVFNLGDDVYKIYNFHPSFFKKESNGFWYINEFFDVRQIEMLASYRNVIKNTHMVRGIIECAKQYVGIIYDYFANYNTFVSISGESKEVMFNGLKCLIENINELIAYDIYHFDIHDRNVLYKGNDVQIIDIDGSYVSFNERYLTRVYKSVFETIMAVIKKKLLSQYSKEDTDSIMREITGIFKSTTCITEMSYKDIEKIEDLRLIK